MMKKLRFRFYTGILLVLVFSAINISCNDFINNSDDKQPAATVTSTVYPTEYKSAITDAINPEPSEVVNNLTAITETNTKLKWKEINGAKYVLMVTLSSDTSYYSGKTGLEYNTGSYYTWVTAAPELRTLCAKSGFGGSNLVPRLKQLLGLSPNTSVSGVVELWVNPAYLFRPAPDNEITDNTAGLNFPDNTASWYRKWFNKLRATQYYHTTSPNHDAYPWTQLGYTYDWGNMTSHQGLSEFVIRSNSNVYVEGIYPVSKYK